MPICAFLRKKYDIMAQLHIIIEQNGGKNGRSKEKYKSSSKELNLRRINNEYVDKDGFIVLIPKYGNTNLDLDT